MFTSSIVYIFQAQVGAKLAQHPTCFHLAAAAADDRVEQPLDQEEAAAAAAAEAHRRGQEEVAQRL